MDKCTYCSKSVVTTVSLVMNCVLLVNKELIVYCVIAVVSNVIVWC